MRQKDNNNTKRTEELEQKHWTKTAKETQKGASMRTTNKNKLKHDKQKHKNEEQQQQQQQQRAKVAGPDSTQQSN